MTRGRAGSLIGAVFGLIYIVSNAGSLPSGAAMVLRALGVAAFVGLLIAIHRTPTTRESGVSATGGFGRGYWLVVAAEVAAVMAGSVVLAGPLGAPRAVVAWITLVVGVHFLALAVVWQDSFFGWLGAAIALCGVVGLVAAAASSSPAAIAIIAGVIPGALLLAAGYRDMPPRGDHPDIKMSGDRVTRR